jgi:hypothetical protein
MARRSTVIEWSWERRDERIACAQRGGRTAHAARDRLGDGWTGVELGAMRLASGSPFASCQAVSTTSA